MATKLFNITNKKLIRKKLRHSMTASEIRLWSVLKNQRLGHRFRRQYSIGDYIVDFCCPRLKLMVEIDGSTHNEDRFNYDDKRQKYLEAKGFTVIRYSGYDVINNIDEVVEGIKNSCDIISTSPPD